MNTTKKSAHTLGPWKVSGAYRAVTTIGGRDICTLRTSATHHINSAGIDEATANACLIASAPELLEALKRCEQHLRFLSIAMPDNRAATILCAETAKQAESAIAKAEGE